MAMIKCKECEGSVSSDATACPQCGKPIKKMSTLKKVGIGFGGLFVLTGIMNAARPPHTPAAPSASVITPVVPLDMPQPKRAVVIDLSATTLFREYQKNEVAADEGYASVERCPRCSLLPCGNVQRKAFSRSRAR